MQRSVAAAGIYLRISQDRDGLAAGVGRQRQDCLKRCAELSWPVVQVYEDNDVSAFSGKRRPQYEAMLEAAERGEIDAIISWHPDRLHRSPAELERFIELVERLRLSIQSVTAGLWDLTTPDGRLSARITGAVARKESEDKSRRLIRKNVELAEQGKLSGGGTRPFGYNKDRLTVCESEAVIVRELAERFLNGGESLWALTADLNEKGIPTTRGGQWRPTTVAQMLKAGRISGRREHQGQIVSTAVWPAIITPEMSDQIRFKLADPKRRTTLSNRRSHLLSGFLRCGTCGANLTIHHQRDSSIKADTRRYGCYRKGEPGVCGKLAIVAPELEREVIRMVCARLDSPDYARNLSSSGSRHVPNVDQDELRRIISEGESEVEQCKQAMLRRELPMSAGLELIKASEELAAAARRSLDELLGVAVSISPWIGRGENLKDEWNGMSLSAQRSIIGAVFDHITIQPSQRGANRFDPARVVRVWKT